MMVEHSELPRDVRLLHSFFHIHRNLARLARRTAVKNGLSFPQFVVLMMIAPRKKMTQKMIGERTFIPKSTLSQAVDGLVKAGYLLRRPVEGNRRESELALSKEGEAFFGELLRQEGSVASFFAKACQALSDRQYRLLLEAHQVIAEALEQEQGDKSRC